MSVPTDPTVYAPPAVRTKLDKLQYAHCVLARENPNAFVTYVLRDEATGGPILSNFDQREWQDLFTEHRRLVLWAHVEAGKTSQLAVGRVLYELGRNSNLRVAIVSNTDGQARKICQAIGKYIEQSAELKQVFPALRRAKNGRWNTNQLDIVRESVSKDPSVQTCGVHGNILGAHFDLLILDDLLDYENTLSAHRREDLWNWYHSTLEGRVTRNSRVLCIGTAWHREDLMHQFSRSKAWFFKRYPAIDPETGQSRWPDRWPMGRIDEKREILGPLEFSRQMLCVARSDEDARFKKDWIDGCLRRGLGLPLIYALKAIPAGCKVYTGVDLGVRVKQGSDLTSMCTIFVDTNGDRRVLDLEAGRWAGPEIVERIVDKHRRYQSLVLVENNAAQEFIVQFTKAHSAVPVQPFTTTGAALHHAEFGIEGLATEMANGKWIIPSVEIGAYLRPAHPELEAWVNELLYYDPRGHPGDRLMSSWFAREAARKSKPKIQFAHQETTRR